MQAIISVNNTQYLVSPGSELLIPLQSTTEKTLTITDVLLTMDNGVVVVGKPNVEGVTVLADILGMEAGDKVRTTKFKAKSRYRKTVGIRPKFTKIKITQVGSVKFETAEPKAAKKRETKA